jgi:hypothetical protein
MKVASKVGSLGPHWVDYSVVSWAACLVELRADYLAGLKVVMKESRRAVMTVAWMAVEKAVWKEFL